MNEKPKPCPFCGHDGDEVKFVTRKSDRAHFAECSWCGARGPFWGTKEEAQKYWNERYRDAGELFDALVHLHMVATEFWGRTVADTCVRESERAIKNATKDLDYKQTKKG